MPYLLRRSGRFHFQMRVGAELESCSQISHVRCALRTGDRREAGRRLATALAYGNTFKDANDLEELGEMLVRKLQPLVADGPPTSAERLKDRLVIEDLVGGFVARARERDFEFVRVPGLVHLFRAFTEQNFNAEIAAEDRAWDARPAPPVPSTPWRARTLAEILPPEAQPRWVSEDEKPLGLPNRFARERTCGDGLNEPVARPAPAPPEDSRLVAMVAGIASRLDRLEPTLAEARAPSPVAEDIRLSDAVGRYLKAEKDRRGSSKSDALAGPVAQFLVDFFGDKRLSEVTRDDFGRLDQALTEIPGIKGFSLEMRKSLYKRYQHAKETGWANLSRASVTTVDLRYRRPLRQLFAWLKEEKLYAGKDLKFSASTEELFAPLPRDRFTDEEIVAFVSAPLFTGCLSRKSFWQPGPYFYQNDLYWIFLILLFCGMRTGEPPQIKLDDLLSFSETDEAGRTEKLWFIDMRPYDPSKGRTPIKDLKHLKRSDFARVIPVHQVLIELGLLERVQRLRARGETRLFPGWEAHRSAADEDRWGKDISRAFDYARRLRHVNLNRANISVYALRHLLADLLDDALIPQRLRNRVLGHLDKSNSENAADEYGSKGLPTAAQALLIINLDTPIIRKVRDILLAAKQRADRGELKGLDPF